MSRLTTAIDKGERKVPEGHKCTHYEMAPGHALKIAKTGETEGTVSVDAKTCKAHPYLYRLKWVSGITMAMFGTEDGIQYMQPIKDMPLPKGAKRERKADHQEVPQGPGAPQARTRKRGVSVPVRSTPGEPDAVPVPRPARQKQELDLGW